MADWEPGWQPLVDAMDRARDPVCRDNLLLVADHVVAEVAGDLDALMATMVPEPIYRFWGATESVAPAGAEAVRAHYSKMFRSGKNRLDFLVDRVVVDAGAVVTEGRFRMTYPGSAFAGRHTEDDEPIHPDDWYLVEYQAIVVWPVRDGKLAGEDLYVGEPPRVRRRLDDGEHPELGPMDRRNGVVLRW